MRLIEFAISVQSLAKQIVASYIVVVLFLFGLVMSNSRSAADTDSEKVAEYAKKFIVPEVERILNTSNRNKLGVPDDVSKVYVYIKITKDGFVLNSSIGSAKNDPKKRTFLNKLIPESYRFPIFEDKERSGDLFFTIPLNIKSVSIEQKPNFVREYIIKNNACANAAAILEPDSQYWNKDAPLGRSVDDWTEDDILLFGTEYDLCFSTVLENQKQKFKQHRYIRDDARRSIENTKKAKIAAREGGNISSRENEFKANDPGTALQGIYSRYLLVKVCFDEGKNYVSNDEFLRSRTAIKMFENRFSDKYPDIDKEKRSLIWENATKVYRDEKKTFENLNAGASFYGRNDLPNKETQFLCRVYINNFLELEKKLASPTAEPKIEKDF